MRRTRKKDRASRRALGQEDIDSFKEAASYRPTTRPKISVTASFEKAAQRSDRWRLKVIRKHLRWMMDICDQEGIRYEEVKWWTLPVE